ncbi:ATP-binding protein (plasmid) [Deinococcus sp. KNUC1210]|uniref:ATP-binding protein n=1 Tax=Deinococcus sp. KNUC1210 TaxID=2917691 RepID=UPI001EF12827|nr:ATP-binding protein [Deinococcus sp. KNUC1210]ULH17933.1 ATP-binding protein [Deinococcus sp. KNUC1210]
MTADHRAAPLPGDPLFLQPGEMAARIRDFDWTSTLGSPSTWSAPLRTYVHLMLASKQPMYLAWSHELIALYNDAYCPILGDKHPAALGKRTADIFGQDGYPGLKPIFDAALRGESAAFENLLVPLVRDGYMEECYFDVSYTPVYVDHHVAGVFSSITETTERVLAARRTRTLAALTDALLGARHLDPTIQAALHVAEDNVQDLPFLLLYLADGQGEDRLISSVGLGDEALAAWRTPPTAWRRTREPSVLPTLPLAVGPWPEPVTTLAVLPLTALGEERRLGHLVVGLNPRKHLDEPYRAFLRLFSGQLATAVRNAELMEELQQRNTELDARNRALSAFEEWTHDLTLDHDVYTLVERAQTLIGSLIPLNALVYYERDGDRWFVKRMLGEFGSEGLRAAHVAGLPHATTGNLRTPYETGETYYQEVYDAEVDHLEPHMTHVTATAMVPLKTSRGVRGVLGFAMFGRGGWSDAERTIVETVGRSLSLALDRAEQVADLARERERLAGRTVELASANEELEAFAYSVSHDLRTPVRHILSFNQLLRGALGTEVDVKAARYLEVVEQSAVRMNTLIDAMLDLSRSSRLPMQVRLVDLSMLVASIRTELKADLLDRQMEWRVSALPLVLGDHDLLRQVLLNLLSNAVKYTRTREQAVIEVWAEERDTAWAVRVKDNGVGFNPQYANKLFGVFQRLHRQEEFEGTGVGLANVRRIVSRHGGQVWAQGSPDAGATFGFTLPKQV